MAKNRETNPQAVYFTGRLLGELSNIKKYPLTVIEAPSGFGKTTALDNFFDDEYFADRQVERITLFGGAEECRKRLCAALAKGDSVSTAALSGADAENVSYINDIIADIEYERETYIVLDNFPADGNEEDMLFSILSDIKNENLHIVVSASHIPDRKYIFSGNNIYYIGADEFLFSKADIGKYFEMAGVVLTPSELDEVMKITGGWIFALYLQLIFYLKNRRFESGILSELIEKAFFDRLSEREKRFYIELSIFKSFSARQAAFMSGESAAEVRKLTERSGFIHSDEKRNEFYFHSLIAEYLNNEFAALSSAEQSKIYKKGGEWKEKTGEHIAAMRLYRMAGAYGSILKMPRTSYELADIGEEDTGEIVFAVLENTPEEVKRKYAEGLVPLAFILFFLNENERLAELVGEICVIAETLDDARKNAILGETELLISFTEYNDIERMGMHHKRAYELLGRKASLINLKSTWTFGALSVMSLYHRESGALSAELASMDSCMPVYYKLTGGHGSGAEYMMRAEAEFMRGTVEEAETYAYRAMFEAKGKKQSSIYQCGLFLLAEIAAFIGDRDMLSEEIFEMSESAAGNNEDLCRYSLDLFLGYICAVTGHPQKAADWLVKGDINENRIAPMAMPFAFVVYGRILLEQKKYTKLWAMCAYAAQTAENNVLPQIYFHIYSAAASLALGRNERAEAELKSAFEKALSDRIYMPFAQNFRDIKPLLERLGNEEICGLGHSFEDAQKKLRLAEPGLSPREKEVAELIRQGFTNKQIASRLYISISTVKMTISNIFEKTGARSRMQI